jgi:histidine triad (HIT) family protein
MADDCLFCRIIRREIPSPLIYESKDCVAFRDIKPQAPTHVLIVPRQHVVSLNEADDAPLMGQLLLAAAEVARQEGIAESGYRTVINTNADAGQAVFHIHVHVLGGRSLGWPPG